MIYSNSEKSEQFFKQNAFSTCSWRFLRSNQLEQLEFKLEKKYWDLETGRKIENIVILSENVYMQSNFSSRHDISPFLLHSRNNLMGILYLHTLYVFINGKRPPYSPSQSADLHPIFEF